eukprot:gene9760-9917_t
MQHTIKNITSRTSVPTPPRAATTNRNVQSLLPLVLLCDVSDVSDTHELKFLQRVQIKQLIGRPCKVLEVHATIPRRELLATGAATVTAALCGATGAARAAGEASATRAITSVTRPLQLKKKEENKAALKEQIEKVKAGEADPKSLP